MVPGDRLVCMFITSRMAGDRFSQWPLHITIVPWFRSAASSARLTQELEGLLGGYTPFNVLMGEEALFGARRNQAVRLVQLPSPLQAVERVARNYLHALDAWIVDESTKVNRSYRPHVTVQGKEQLQEGEQFICETVYLIKQLGGIKEVDGLINLAL